MRPSWPVLFLLHEFAALDRLDAVERAMGLVGGYGVQLWPILQDVHQLRAPYGQRSSTMGKGERHHYAGGREVALAGL